MIEFIKGGSGGTGGGGSMLQIDLNVEQITKKHNGIPDQIFSKSDADYKLILQQLIDYIKEQAKKTIPLNDFTNLIGVIKKLVDYQSSL